jgi:hypothetical protein
VFACALTVAFGVLVVRPPTGGGADARLLDQAGRSLLVRHISDPDGGWAWRSSIQRPHLLTDRDVGAAGVAMGLLALYDTTHDAGYLDGARRAGDWLLAVAQPADGGLRWPDDHDRGRVSDTHFTSFDDGAPGIADLLWRLGDVTHDRRYIDAALAGMRWLESRAEGLDGGPCRRICRWRYYDDASDYRTGMGEGDAGVVYAFDLFARRSGDATFERFALAGARYLESLISVRGAIPEHPGGTGFDTGFLSGSAGDAFMFLSLYDHTRDPRWLHDARRLLGWVRRHGRRVPGGLAWPIEIDPRNGDDDRFATGMEEGAAGIGWVELQAYKLIRDPVDLRTAVQAGAWLSSSALRERGGKQWPEDLGRPLVHTSLNNGTAGVGWFLHDLALTTGRRDFEEGAHGAEKWLAEVARKDRAGIYWNENRGSDRRWHLVREQSWHWGTAGIAAFLARMRGWQTDMPGEEPAL